MTDVAPIAPARRRRRTGEPSRPDPVTAYALDVVAGRIVAGGLVRKACERHLADLADGEARGLRFDVAAAERAIGFFPLLRHYKGEWGPLPGVRALGLPIVLEAWEKFIIGSLFGWKRADGTRRFRKLYLEVARKNGKTLLAAGIAILLAFFDGEAGAEVYSVASKRDQAKLVWTDADQLIKHNPGLASRVGRYALSLVHEPTASVFRPLGRDSDSDTGINAHGGIVDELHALESRDVLDQVETSMSARRQPVLATITTAGKKRESVWADERADAVAIIEGRSEDDSVLALIYTLDEGDDEFDEAVWPKANPNLGVSVNVATLREAAAKARRSPAAWSAYMQFRMNVPVQQSTRAISIEEWDACSGRLELPSGELEPYEAWYARTFPPARVERPADADPDAVLFLGHAPGAGAYGGLDLASVRDLTAFILLFRDEATGCYDVLVRFWCPEDGVVERSATDHVPYADWVREGFLIATPGNVTDYDFVRHEIIELALRYSLGQIGYDAWNATQLALDLSSAGASMIPVHQTHAGLAPAWRELEKLILERKLRHGGHPILRWMAGNVEVELDAAGNAKPSKRHSSERIDGMVALDMALGRWMALGGVQTWTAA